jgi:hypothetical protein
MATVPRPFRNFHLNPTPMTPVDLKTELGSALSSNDILRRCHRHLEPVMAIQVHFQQMS